MRLIRSQSTDIRRNLATEEWLLSEEAPSPPLLFLWQAGPAVVIGKNQNPWMECRPGRLEEQGLQFARRISGGGAVYHDSGNLNYACILPRATYRRDEVFEWSLSAITKLGIPAERLGRSGLGVGGRKFSGTAFCYRGSRVLHHGTLLVSADLEKLEQALTAPAIAIRSRAVPSERSPVMNLAELIPGLTTDRVARMLAAGLEALECPGDEGIRRLEEKHHSPDWIYGATPPFEADLFSLHLRVEQGRIVEAKPSSRLVGCPFRSIEMARRLEREAAEKILALGL